MTNTQAITRHFYYTQRFRAPLGGMENADTSKSQADYNGDYMGSTEYECGGLNKSFKALRDAPELSIALADVDGVSVSMLYDPSQGDPSSDLLKWYKGGERGLKDKYARKCPAKEASRFDVAISAIKDGKERDGYEGTLVWWAHGIDDAGDNVIFGLTDEPHFANFVAWINNRREAEGKEPVALPA